MELARRVLAAEGRRARIVLCRPGRDAALKSDHLGIDEVTDVLSFPIDGRAALPRNAAGARRCRPLPAGRRLAVARAAGPRASTCSVTSTATRWTPENGRIGRNDETPGPVALPELQPRRRGDRPAVRTQRNLWIHFAVAVLVLVLALGAEQGSSWRCCCWRSRSCSWRSSVNTAVEAAVDVASTAFDPDGEAREGHGGRRGSRRGFERRCGRISRLLGRGGHAQLALSRPSFRRASRAHVGLSQSPSSSSWPSRPTGRCAAPRRASLRACAVAFGAGWR